MAMAYYGVPESPVSESASEVLTQALQVLISARARLQGTLGHGSSDSTQPAAPPSITGLALDVRTVTRDVDGLLLDLVNRLGAPA